MHITHIIIRVVEYNVAFFNFLSRNSADNRFLEGFFRSGQCYDCYSKIKIHIV